ncbi:hypothetical protein GWI33_017664 [Rhynchophorus ferrugineus]|uniref:Uncharacterized protein n=1 Tax=Rhynchophorus ferrugineus TaxID=354439 RepID=A0A834HXQ9_RHYFE|nr:hypothetical protein GWI33_017664 [Rhynchophorus ferrugineus]
MPLYSLNIPKNELCSHEIKHYPFEIVESHAFVPEQSRARVVPLQNRHTYNFTYALTSYTLSIDPDLCNCTSTTNNNRKPSFADQPQQINYVLIDNLKQ